MVFFRDTHTFQKRGDSLADVGVHTFRDHMDVVAMDAVDVTARLWQKLVVAHDESVVGVVYC